MAYATAIFFLFRLMPQLKDNLQGFQILWGQLLSVTTFTLTFFLNQSYALWRKCYELSRRLQGRLNDLGMTLAAHAARKTPSSPSEPATYTNASRQLLELMGRYIRLFNLLTYASFTRSHRPILTPRGMRRLVERGLLTPTERLVLVEAEIPATQRHNAVILWITRCFLEGRNSGHIGGGAGFEQQFLEKIHVIRAQYGGIGDELQGRMPLAYAHIVQVLVDVILWMYPVMAFSSGMAPTLGILGTGLLTMSYQGLFDLAKQFLDPYDNENYGKGDDPLCVDTLVAETNSGSVRWMNGFDQMPFSAQRIKDGELFDYQLPPRGYSVEELAQMEEERAQRERDLQEKREREEAERLRVSEEELLRVQQLQMNNETSAVLPANGTMSVVNDTLTQGASLSQEKINGSSEDLDKPRAYQDKLIDIAIATENDDDVEIKVQGHRITSLGDGRPITFNKASDSRPLGSQTRDETAKQGLQRNQTQQTKVTDLAAATLAAAVAVSEGATARELLAAKSREAVDSRATPKTDPAGPKQDEPVEVNGVYPNMMLQPDFGFFNMNNVKWYEEVRDDGQEYRLSQMMADEEWEEERRYQEELKLKEPPMSYEEYRDSVVGLIEAVADELQETRDILSGSELEAKRSREQVPLKYDQTKLDGISQLWGLPPSDPSALYVTEAPTELTYEENSFDTVMQLWGRSPARFSQDEGTMIGSNFNGVTGLWDSNSGRGVPGGFGELPWMNEVDSDGTEFRLSQILANEVWEEYEPPIVEAPMSLEDYSKQVNEKSQDLEEEWKETVAILNAPPGADYNEADVSEDDTAEKGEVMRLDTSPVDATSEIRAEVQAAYVAAKQEEKLIEQQRETLSKSADDLLAVLFDDSDLHDVVTKSALEVQESPAVSVKGTETVLEGTVSDEKEGVDD